MELNLLKNISNHIKDMDIGKFINEIEERFNEMEEELVIDRYEGDYAICEDRKTGAKKEILKTELQEGLEEGSVIKKENGKYIKAEKEQEIIEKRIEDKMNQIWKI